VHLLDLLVNVTLFKRKAPILPPNYIKIKLYKSTMYFGYLLDQNYASYISRIFGAMWYACYVIFSLN
jgi:hypothetical protein